MSTKSQISLKTKNPSYIQELGEKSSLGEHLRYIRCVRNESQACVAEKLNVSSDTITGWELGRNEPQIRHTPKILSYLSYIPIFNFAGNSLSKRILQYLYVHGITRKELAHKVALDPASISRVISEKNVNTKTKRLLWEFIKTAYKTL